MKNKNMKWKRCFVMLKRDVQFILMGTFPIVWFLSIQTSRTQKQKQKNLKIRNERNQSSLKYLTYMRTLLPNGKLECSVLDYMELNGAYVVGKSSAL